MVAGRPLDRVRGEKPGSSIRELWLVRRTDGSQRHRLTNLGGVAQGPAWSPDGKRLVFSRNVETNRFDIYTIGAEGKGVRLMTSRMTRFEPAWSPDGKTIVFAEGGATRRHRCGNGARNGLPTPTHDSSPAWAPRTEGEDG